MTCLYLDLSSGISGDMFTAALLDLGANETKLRAVLCSLQLPGFTIAISRIQRAALDMCDFKVALAQDNHDADMAFLFGHPAAAPLPPALQPGMLRPATEPTQSHHHASGHAHAHPHNHPHEHVHRNLADITAIIERSAADVKAKTLALRIFNILAEAEAQAHGVSLDEVHFHEVGALDSIVDILSAAVCVTDLNIDAVYVSTLQEGHGTVNCAHGTLPIPVPAVSRIAERYHLPITFTDLEGELITPTGAAILAALHPKFTAPPRSCIAATGFGAGKRAYARPSFVRALLLEPAAAVSDDCADDIIKLECNIDDMSGELFGHLMTKLQAAGARDVSFKPIFMKKNRPAYEVCILADPAKLEDLATVLLTESTTIGLRYQTMHRIILQRKEEDFDSSLGRCRVKCCTLPQSLGGKRFIYPEYENLLELAAAHKLPLKTVDALVRGEIVTQEEK